MGWVGKGAKQGEDAVVFIADTDYKRFVARIRSKRDYGLHICPDIYAVVKTIFGYISFADMLQREIS